MFGLENKAPVHEIQQAITVLTELKPFYSYYYVAYM